MSNDHRRLTDPVSTERSDFRETTPVDTEARIQAFWIRWPQYPGSSSDWGVLRTSMSPRSWSPCLWDTDRVAATETYLSMRTRRYYDSRMRMSNRREAERAVKRLRQGLAKGTTSSFSPVSLFFPVATQIWYTNALALSLRSMYLLRTLLSSTPLARPCGLILCHPWESEILTHLRSQRSALSSHSLHGHQTMRTLR